MVVVVAVVVRGLSARASGCRRGGAWPARRAAEGVSAGRTLLVAVHLAGAGGPAASRVASSSAAAAATAARRRHVVVMVRARRVVLSAGAATEPLVARCAAEKSSLRTLLVVIPAGQPAEVAGQCTGRGLPVSLQGRQEGVGKIRVHFFTNTSSLVPQVVSPQLDTPHTNDL